MTKEIVTEEYRVIILQPISGPSALTGWHPRWFAEELKKILVEINPVDLHLIEKRRIQPGRKNLKRKVNICPLFH